MADPRKDADKTDAKASEKPAPAAAVAETDTPDEPVNPNETVPGGQYMRGTRFVAGKHYGGDIADANGRILAVFGPKEINTGNPKDGHKPEAE